MMSNGLLLDTSVIILAIRGDTGVLSRLNGSSPLYISATALGELYVGAFGSPRQVQETAKVDRFRSGTTELSCDHETAKTYGQVVADLRRRGKLVPTNDVWIAATALQYGFTLAARDAHFDVIHGLDVEKW